MLGRRFDRLAIERCFGYGLQPVQRVAIQVQQGRPGGLVSP